MPNKYFNVLTILMDKKFILTNKNVYKKIYCTNLLYYIFLIDFKKSKIDINDLHTRRS